MRGLEEGDGSYAVPVDSPVHARCVGLVVVCAEADIEHRRSMLICVDQFGIHGTICKIIVVDILVPRGDKQLGAGFRRKYQGGHCVAWWRRKLDLSSYRKKLVSKISQKI